MKFGSKKLYVILSLLSLVVFISYEIMATGKANVTRIKVDKLLLAFVLFFLFVVTFYNEFIENTSNKTTSRLWRAFLVCIAMLFGQAVISSLRTANNNNLGDWGAFLIIGTTIVIYFIGGLLKRAPHKK